MHPDCRLVSRNFDIPNEGQIGFDGDIDTVGAGEGTWQMLTPSQYKQRYESIDVLLEDGNVKPIAVNQYRLFGKNHNAKARSDFLNTLAKRGIDTELRVDTNRGIVYVDPRLTQHEDAVKKGKPDLMLTGNGPPLNVPLGGRSGTLRSVRLAWDTRVDTRVTNWEKLARLVFVGKGSPEACQVVLQLANHWGLAPDGVQAYANSALGLDCNGFVGNYLWHVQQRKAWTSLASDHELGPDSPIRTGFFDRYKHRLLDRWESLNTAKMYIMMEVDKDDGVVINGGTAANAGHIVITEPNSSQDRPGKGGKKSVAVGVVESTASHSPGLWESWYTCVSVDSKKKIFVINREDMSADRRQISFKIAAVS
jgi:hypothetical protein